MHFHRNKKQRTSKLKFVFLAVAVFTGVHVYAGESFAQQAAVNLRASDFPHPAATPSLSPSALTVTEGATFEVSVLLNTHNGSANSFLLNLKYSASKLNIVNQSSGGKSLISYWLDPPAYSNVEGTAHFSGLVPNGIITSSGLLILT